MPTLHEQMLTDAYWEGPPASDLRLAFGIRAINWLFSQRDSTAVDTVYRQARQQGTQVRPIETGCPLELGNQRSVIKIVQDFRFTSSKPLTNRHAVPPQEFDEQAAVMANTPWLRTPPTSTTLQTPEGEVELARSILYLVPAQITPWLIAKRALFLGRGGKYFSFHMHPEIVGHVTQFENPPYSVTRKLVAAQVLTPQPPVE